MGWESTQHECEDHLTIHFCYACMTQANALVETACTDMNWIVLLRLLPELIFSVIVSHRDLHVFCWVRFNLLLRIFCVRTGGT